MKKNSQHHEDTGGRERWVKERVKPKKTEGSDVRLVELDCQRMTETFINLPLCHLTEALKSTASEVRSTVQKQELGKKWKKQSAKEN